MEVPPWSIRAFFKVYSAGCLGVDRFFRILSELPVVFAEPSIVRSGNIAHYDAVSHYRDVENQNSGLFPFEKRMLDRFFPHPPARLLVPGAGGGREVIALLERGYTVDAFEPVAEQVEAANKIITARFGTRVECSTLEEWAEHPQGTYDAIFTGWGMWTHIIHHAERVAALRAFQRVCPSGPVLLSFWRYERLLDHREEPEVPLPLYPEPQNRLEKLTRGWLRQKVLRRTPIERGTGWVAGMYVHYTSEPELREEGALAGWDVAYYERDGSKYPHAVLVPQKGK